MTDLRGALAAHTRSPYPSRGRARARERARRMDDDIILPHPHITRDGLAVVRAALAAPRDHVWYSCSSDDVRSVASVLDAQGMMPASVPHRWWFSCPQQGTPQCDLYNGPARASCKYCHGRGFCASERASSVADLVSVYALGAHNLSLAEGAARQIAREQGVALAAVAWQVIAEDDVRGWPPYRELRHKCAAPLDISPDGFVVMGVQRVHAAPRFDDAAEERLRDECATHQRQRPALR